MEPQADSPAATETATAPAPAVEASAPAAAAPQKVGFFAKVLGLESELNDLRSRLSAEESAHALTRASLATAQARVAEFEAIEKQLDADLATARADAEAAKSAAAPETIQKQVAAEVVDVVSSLGIAEEKLAPVQSDPPAKGEEFSSLKGRDRAAAAFNAQFAAPV